MVIASSAAVATSLFSALKSIATPKLTSSVSATPISKKLTVKASIKQFGVAVAATSIASALLASNALAIEVLLGSSGGDLVFEPSSFSIAVGEAIVFKNNAGFPHNVVFDEDEVPSGVDVAKISMSEEDLLNAPGETYTVLLPEKGTYKFYCAPHQGAGMVGTVTVN